MVTRNPVSAYIHTPLSESSQCFKICIWFPRHMFKDLVLFSALDSLSKSNYTENPWKPRRIELSKALRFVFGFHAMFFRMCPYFPHCFLAQMKYAGKKWKTRHVKSRK